MESEDSFSQTEVGDKKQGVADESSLSGSSFDELSAGNDPGIIAEFIQFLRYNKKWWLTPIIIVTLLLIGAAILLPSPVAPFIYTFF